MNYMTKKQVLNAVQKHFLISEEQGEVFGVFLKGSQNYVDDKFHESSDVDTVAVLIPSFKILLAAATAAVSLRIPESAEIVPFGKIWILSAASQPKNFPK